MSYASELKNIDERIKWKQDELQRATNQQHRENVRKEIQELYNEMQATIEFYQLWPELK